MNASAPEPKLRAETPSPGVLSLIIDRPSRRNALDIETYNRLGDAILAAEADAQIGAIVISGAHGNFTAGNDLADFQRAPPLAGSPAIRFLETINACGKPLIGAVEGHAIGIGVTMLLHFDFAYAGRGAKLRMPFVSLGLCPEGASSYLLPRVAGMKRAMELLLLGEAFDGATAAASGIVTSAVEDGGALDQALATARKIAALPPEAVRLTKRLIKRHDVATARETLLHEGEEFSRRLASREAQTAFAAFFAKAG